MDALVQAGLRGGSIREERAGILGVGFGSGGADHVRDAQALVRDDVVGADHRQRGLVGVVGAPAAHLAVQSGDLLDRPAVPGGAVLPLAARERPECALSVREGFGIAPSVPRTGLVLTLGGGEEVGYAHVDAGHGAGRGERFGGDFVAGEDDVPLSSFALDRDGLDPAAHGTVPVDADVSDALQPDAGDRVVRGGVPAAAVPVLGEVDRVEPVHPTKTRITGRVTGLDAAEERGERLVQAA